MSRPLRIEYPGALFHITARGNERRLIFRDDSDRHRFIRCLAEAVDRFGWILTAYVLMPNHFHLVLELTKTTLSRGMQWLNGTYAQAFNRRHDRVGHLFQGRFKSFLVEKETYMLEVLRYVVLNPVRAKICPQPENYRWSSFRSTAGLAAARPWLASDDVLINFGEDRPMAQRRYRRFVEDGIGLDRKPWDDLIGQMYLGSDDWVQSEQDRVRMKPRDSEHPRAQRAPRKCAMAEVVDSVARTLSIDAGYVRTGHGGTARMLAAWIAAHDAHLTLNSIAAGLRLSSAGYVSRLVGRCDTRLSRDPALQVSLQHCRETLHHS